MAKTRDNKNFWNRYAKLYDFEINRMPEPNKALSNISGVLKPTGFLFAPTYAHGLLLDSTWNLSVKILKFIGFETYSKWTPETYVEFIEQNGFKVEYLQMLKAAFPLVYLEAKNKK